MNDNVGNRCGFGMDLAGKAFKPKGGENLVAKSNMTAFVTSIATWLVVIIMNCTGGIFSGEIFWETVISVRRNLPVKTQLLNQLFLNAKQ